MKNKAPFLIYDAAAGSGKTYTLVKEYLTLLLQQNTKNYYQQLLALTFTNKAVAEMKTRIIESLVLFSEISSLQNTPTMMQDIAIDLHIDLEVVSKRAKAILIHIVHNYAGFSVETLDRFNHRLIRTFARDLSLSSNFEVVLDTEALLTEAVDKLIDKTGEDSHITKVLIDYTLEKTDDDKSWDISKDILKASKLLGNENATKHLEILEEKSLQDFNEFKKALTHKKKEFIACAKNTVLDLKALIYANGLEQDHFIAALKTFFNQIENKLFEKINLQAVWLIKLDEKNLYTATFAKSSKNAVLVAAIDSISAHFKEKIHKSLEVIKQLLFIQNILKNLTPLSVINLVQKELHALQEEQNLLPISQFNALIQDEIKDQPSPFIYERLGERYTHFFIDEFQDTSILQWQNLIPLLDNTLSQAQEKTEGSLLLVGDVKQAIYRWRGGNPEQFLSLINGNSPFLGAVPEVENLPVNYRSFDEIVSFNNKLFTFASQYFGDEQHKQLYLNGNAQKTNTKKGGFVQIEFIEGDKKEDKSKIYAEKTLGVINELVASGFEYNDICVLTRKKADGVLLSAYLLEQGITVISAETLLLANSKWVQFIINTITLSQHPNDAETKIKVLDFLHKHLNIILAKHDFFSSFLENGVSFSEILKYHEIDFSLQKIQRLSIYQSAEYIIKQFKIDVIVDAYVFGLMDLIFEYTQKPQADTLGFLDYWEIKKEKASIATGKGANGVQFMTVHKAKGLEFPAVIFPFADVDLYKEIEPKTWISIPESLSHTFNEMLINFNATISEYSPEGEALYTQRRNTLELDNFNILYVTLTRASQQLYIITEQAKPIKEGIKTYPQLFTAFLQQQEVWSDEKMIYNFGNFTQQQVVKEKEHLTTISPSYISSSPQAHNIHIITSQVQHQKSVQDAIEEGNLFHDTMEQIKYHTDFDSVFNTMIERAIISEEKINTLKEKVKNVMEHPDLKTLFNANFKVENERAIITKEGYLLRPDRVNIDLKNNTVQIVDYKTGVPSYAHEDQINGYASALSEMGYTILNKILVYTNETLIVNKI